MKRTAQAAPSRQLERDVTGGGARRRDGRNGSRWPLRALRSARRWLRRSTLYGARLQAASSSVTICRSRAWTSALTRRSPWSVGFGVGLFGCSSSPIGPAHRATLAVAASLRCRPSSHGWRSCLASIAVSAPLWATAVAHLAKKSMGTRGSNVASGLAIGHRCVRHGARHAVARARGGGIVALRARSSRSRCRSAAWAPRWCGVGRGDRRHRCEHRNHERGGGMARHLGRSQTSRARSARAVACSLAVLGAYFAATSCPAHADRSRSALGLLPLGFTLEAAVRARRQAGHRPRRSSRGAPLGKMSLALLRRATDRDHDGYSALFGGGDCNDHDRAHQPAAPTTSRATASTKIVRARTRRSGRRLPRRRRAARRGPISSPRGSTSSSSRSTRCAPISATRATRKPVSPNLDALAARSVVFDRAYSLASYTGKSVGPLLIGKYPSETHRGWGHFNKFSTRRHVGRRAAAEGGHPHRRRPRSLVLRARRSGSRADSTCATRARSRRRAPIRTTTRP